MDFVDGVCTHEGPLDMIVGGKDQLPRKLLEGLENNIQYNSKVVKILTIGEKAMVE